MMVGPHIEPGDMHAVLDREASVAEEERVIAHLAGCDPCRACYAGWLLPELLAGPVSEISAGAPPRRIVAGWRWIAAAAVLVATATGLHQSPSKAPHIIEVDPPSLRVQTSPAGLLAIEVVRERSGPRSRSRETWTLKRDGSVERRLESRLEREQSIDVALSATVVRTTREMSIASATGVIETNRWSSR